MYGGVPPITLTVIDPESADNALVDNKDSNIPNQETYSASEDSDEDTPLWEKKLAKLEKK